MWQRAGLVMGAVFFLTIGMLATYAEWPKLKAEAQKVFGDNPTIATK
jgi:hypothetical protein